MRPGTIQLDERKISVISVRTESFIDTVENVTTGTEVRKGQPLLRLYSPLIATAARRLSRIADDARNHVRRSPVRGSGC